MSVIISLYVEFIRAVSRTMSGRLFNEEEIKDITSGAVGKYFADFFPTPRDEREAQDKVSDARQHISAASSIILEMQASLESQNNSLERLLAEIAEKKELAERYESIANSKRVEFDAFKEEMAVSLRTELQEQAAKGRWLRRTVSLLIWVITLVAGAWLGAHFNDIVDSIG